MTELLPSEEKSIEPWAARMRRESEWLAGLKQGDEVAIWNGYHHRLGRITRTTPTQIHVAHDKFHRKNGRAIGDHGFRSTSIDEPTQEIREQAEHRLLHTKLSNVEWGKKSLSTLRAVTAAMEQDK